MDKELEDMTFDELVKLGVHIELDGIVQGKPLKSRVYALMQLATQWASLKAEQQAKSKKKSPAS